MMHPWNQGIWERLIRARELPPALLLSGPKGVGKRDFAREFAKTKLCSAPVLGGFACGKCEACRLFEQQAHPDFRLLEPASAEADAGEATEAGPLTASRFILIGQIRDLNGFLAVSAHLAGHKIIVVQPADKLHPNAANALLKTLEEPPSRTIFVLVADEAQHLPPTVRSRCFNLAFPLPGHDVALRWLAASGVPNAELALAQAGGAPLAAADLQTGGFWSIRGAFLETLVKPNVQLGTVLARAPAEHLGELLGQLYRWCYDLISLRTAGRLRYHLDHAKPLAQLAVTADMDKLMAFIRDLEAALRAREHPLNPRLVLERLMVGYLRAVGAKGF